MEINRPWKITTDPTNRPNISARGLPTKIGAVLAGRNEKILQSQKMLKALNDFWASALPLNFLEHLRFAGFKDGILLIETDSPSYSYELYLRSHELLHRMRELHFPIKRIKFIFGDFIR